MGTDYRFSARIPETAIPSFEAVVAIEILPTPWRRMFNLANKSRISSFGTTFVTVSKAKPFF
jgi:hypothetical protein